MGYLISQTIIYLLIAAGIGFLAGYLLKQFLAGKTIEQVESMWSEKVRRASRELDTLRSDLRVQIQRTGDLENTEESLNSSLAGLQSELAAERDKSAEVRAMLSAKASTIKALEAAAAGAAKKAADLEEIVQSKDTSIQSLEAELASAVNIFIAKDSNVQTLEARIGELEPLTGKLATAISSVETWEARYKSLETSKNGDLAALKARLGVLEPLTGKVREWESRYNAMLKEKDSSLAKLTASVSALEPIKSKVDSIAKENNTLTSRIRELEASEGKHLAKIQALEESSKRALTAASERETEIQHLRARVADVEPLERRLHYAGEEINNLRLQVTELESMKVQPAELDPTSPCDPEEVATLRAQLAAHQQRIHTWDHRFSSIVDEKDTEIAHLRIDVAQLRGKLQAAAALTKGDRDDLKKIRGIGPALEKRLNDYGVAWYKQLALWTKQEITDFEKLSPGFQNRVERDQWVVSAKEEHLKKYGETL